MPLTSIEAMGVLAIRRALTPNIYMTLARWLDSEAIHYILPSKRILNKELAAQISYEYIISYQENFNKSVIFKVYMACDNITCTLNTTEQRNVLSWLIQNPLPLLPE